VNRAHISDAAVAVQGQPSASRARFLPLPPAAAAFPQPVDTLPCAPVTPDTAFSEFRRFCELAYYPRQRIYFFVAWPDRRPQGQREGPDPDRVGLPPRLHGKKLWYIRDGIRQEINVFPGISTRIGSRMFRHTFNKLQGFNRLGYEVFCCPSTLTNNWRAGFSVYESRWVIVESDSQSLQEQMAWVARHPEITFAVFTGGKSIHCWILIREVSNPQYISYWKDILRARSAGYKCDHFGYKVAAAKVGAWAAADGVSYDPAVLCDPSRMVRVPGFRHRKGGMARLIKPTMLLDVGTKDNRLLSLPPPLPDSASLETPANAQAIPLVTPQAKGQKPMVGHGQWLKDLQQCELLARHGIPARHHRRVLHHSLFTVSRMRGWSEEEMVQQWKAVVSIRPENIGCTAAEAVEDLARHWRSAQVQRQSPRFVLPRLQDLPRIVADHRQQELQDTLKRLGCPDPYSARRIICEVLWPMAVGNPRVCQQGGAAIEAARMEAVSRRHNPTIARRWLDEMGILRVISRSYQVGRFFMRYRVSVHQLIWLLGYQVADLQWQWQADVRVPPADRKVALTKEAEVAFEDSDAEFFAPAPGPESAPAPQLDASFLY